MDAMITAAGRALSAGDPLGAMKRIALRDDPPALALRGIAMAQVGDFARARELLGKAARAFGRREPVSWARCVVAEAEIALASRDLSRPPRALELARAVLEKRGDLANAAHARLLEARRSLLIGRLADSERLLKKIAPAALPRALRAVHALTRAGVALRRLQLKQVRSALAEAAAEAQIPALAAEVELALRTLEAPAARIGDRAVTLDEVEALRNSPSLVVDACRRFVGEVNLARRPILFAIARALAENDGARERLIERAFGARRINESHRARLRVEIGRLRKLLRKVATINAIVNGFQLAPLAGREVVVLLPPLDEPHAELLALLADGEAWSSSAIALALGTSQRSAQRALDALLESRKVQPFGRGRAQRWVAQPLPGIATSLLLPAPLPDQ